MWVGTKRAKELASCFFFNTRPLLMKKPHADQLTIRTIRDILPQVGYEQGTTPNRLLLVTFFDSDDGGVFGTPQFEMFCVLPNKKQIH